MNPWFLFNRRDKERDAKVSVTLSDPSATWKDGFLTLTSTVTATPLPPQSSPTTTPPAAIKSGENELFRSNPIKEGSANASYDIDVTSLESVELSVENGGDGNLADWGVWLAPELKR